MKSEVVKAVFQDELERNQRLVARYEEELETLPKGSIFKRKIGNQEYLYLNYRDGERVISKFWVKQKNLTHKNYSYSWINEKNIKIF